MGHDANLEACHMRAGESFDYARVRHTPPFTVPYSPPVHRTRGPWPLGRPTSRERTPDV